MKSSDAPNPIELDGIVELFRNHTFGAPWPNENVLISSETTLWRLPNQLKYLRDSWMLRNAGERSDAKIAIRSISQTNDCQLNFSLQATAWDEVRPLHEAYSSLSSDTRTRIESGELATPNIGVVHVVACTTDGWIALFRRNETSHYHPRKWSATFEEGLAPEDGVGKDFFRRAARRGLAEEVAAELGSLPLDCFKIMSVVMERSLNNPAVIILAELPFTRDSLPVNHPSDELTPGSIAFLAIAKKDILDAICSSSGPGYGAWHPSAKFRLLIVLARYFGEGAVAATIAT